MKYIGVILFLTILFSCSEEFNGQYPVHKNPPKPVTDVVVQNIAGGAYLFYQLPDETDMLYVKAEFQLSTGKNMEIKVSVYSNVMLLEGFGRSAKHTIKLTAVDRSRNESEPVYVEIEPEDSPIYSIMESMKMVSSFGGIKLSWENSEKYNAIVNVMKKESGVYKHLETYYSSETEANRSVRGQEAVETLFAICVSDAYSNTTDTIKDLLTPWFEEKLNKSNYKALQKSSKFSISQYGTSNMAVVWDDIITDVSKNGIYYYSGNTEGYKPYFSFDLGQTTKLSRFRLWSRADYYFQLHSPKEIAVYGTNDYNVASNPESDDSLWTLLLTGESRRPSGLGSDVPATAEDIAYAQEGEEYEFPIEATAVRYIRYKQLSGWTGSSAMTIVEMTFWGNTNVND